MVQKAGNLLVVIGLVAGLALAIVLFQWDSRERAAAIESSPPAAEGNGALATGGVANNAAAKSEGGAIQNGKVVYNKFCNGCHPNGKAGVGPAVIGVLEESAKNTIRQGKGSMPAFGEGQISEEQLGELVAYMKSLK